MTESRTLVGAAVVSTVASAAPETFEGLLFSRPFRVRPSLPAGGARLREVGVDGVVVVVVVVVVRINVATRVFEGLVLAGAWMHLLDLSCLV